MLPQISAPSTTHKGGVSSTTARAINMIVEQHFSLTTREV